MTSKTLICNICGKEYENEIYEDGSYSGAKVDNMPVCDLCWSIEYENRKPYIINYSLMSYTTGKTDILERKTILLKDLPEFVNALLKMPGLCLNFILIEKSCKDPDLNNKKIGEE
jgi:hypothetical protein